MKHRYIGYIPTPRAGSKSITHALISAGIYDRRDSVEIPNRNGFFLSTTPLTLKDKIFPRWWETPESSKSTFMFTVLRNPYDRIVSAWLHSVKKKWVPASITLPEFCEFLYCFATGQYPQSTGEGPVEAALRYYADWPGDDHDVRRSAFAHASPWEFQKQSMLDYKRYPDALRAQLLNSWMQENQPMPPLATFPIILRPGMRVLSFENLKNEIALLTEELGWPSLELPHFNNGHCGDHAAYHTPATLGFVKEFYRSEIWIGSYTGPSRG